MNKREDYQKMAEILNSISADGGVFFIATKIGNRTRILGRLEKMEVKENSVSFIPKNSFYFVKDESFEIPPGSINWFFSIEPASGFVACMRAGTKGASHNVSICNVVVIKIFSEKNNFLQSVAENCDGLPVEKIPREIID
ncbi:MAG TPA: hypothetical protein PKZ36_02285 [Candidatus Paceibacterota bacterium]|nr:hypothetical protein [Candidatus Paceibacterota bacterium]HPT18211.1 hypothetical protein [Candidatus Paceibacterota bacterium]